MKMWQTSSYQSYYNEFHTSNSDDNCKMSNSITSDISRATKMSFTQSWMKHYYKVDYNGNWPYMSTLGS
jgi:hypothetical protein